VCVCEGIFLVSTIHRSKRGAKGEQEKDNREAGDNHERIRRRAREEQEVSV
jgi:hypothetical protein